MKCSVCGKELSDKAKFCTGCGSPVESSVSDYTANTKKYDTENHIICPKCGASLSRNVRYCTLCGYNVIKDSSEKGIESISEDHHKEKDANSLYPGVDEDEILYKPKKSNKIIIGIVVFLVVVLVAIVGILLYKGTLGDKLSPKKEERQDIAVEKSSSKEEDTTEGSVSISIATTEQEKEETSETDMDISVASTEGQEETNGGLDLKYCDNTYCNINNNLTKDDFQYVECPDDNYHFYYPKYLYNHWSYSPEDGFYFWYDDNDTTITSLHVYSENCSGDLFANAKDLSSSMKNSVKKIGYTFPDNIEKHGVGDDGIMQVVVSGWTDSAQNDAKYMVGGNNGTKNYIMEVTYPDYDVKNDVEDWDYIVNTLYRYCSFSGSTKSPYPNYNAFVEDN